MRTKRMGAWTTGGLALAVLLSTGRTGWAGPLARLGDAQLRANGSMAGPLKASTWHSGARETAGKETEHLGYDLKELRLRGDEGSVGMVFRRGESGRFETLFGLANADWDPQWGLSVEWGQPTFFSAVESPEWYTYGELTTPPRRGDTVVVGFAWKGSDVALWVNGKQAGAGATEIGKGKPFSQIVKDARYLFVGGRSVFQGARVSPEDRSEMKSELLAFQVDDRFDGWRSLGLVESVAADRAVYGAGQEVVVTLRGVPDGRSSFTLAGLAADVPMEEVDDGVYVGKFAVPAGADLEAELTGTLADPATGQTAVLPGGRIRFDATGPSAPARVLATAPWGGEVEVSWEASASSDVESYRVYRGEGKNPTLATAAAAGVRGLKLVDTRVIPGLEYRYVVVAVDKAGNASEPSVVAAAAAVAGDGPKLAAVRFEPQGKPLRPGAVVTVGVTGESGAAVKVDLGTLAAGLALSEEGRTGRYTGSYTVKDGDVQPTKGLHRVVAHLTDVFGASSLAGAELAVVGLDGLNDKIAPTVTKVSHDGWRVAGLSGKLVAGDVATVTVEGEPACYAAFELSEVAGRVAMKETGPGVYTGSFVVPPDAAGSAVPLTAYLADDGGNETAVVAEEKLSFDTRLRLTVTAKDKLLPADRVSRTTLTAKATDANGKPLGGRELALTLSTTEEYTGVVGGGAVEGLFASKEDVDDLEIRWGGKTDSFGEVSAAYTAGFAAKTALVVAKDLAKGDVGAGWLNTYVASTVSIELTAPARKGTADRAVLRMTADPSKLTADGRSTSRLKVWLTDLAGVPLPAVRVSFSLGGTNGSLRTLQGVTDAKGVATAEYRAGTASGAVTVTAVCPDYGVTGAVRILLLADAPAKVDLVASARSLVANGSGKATLSVRVSDIHDNPNDFVPVSFALLQGSGTLSASSLVTDRFGEGVVTFTSGHTVGTAVLEARHTSRAPTDDELRRIYGTVFVPRWDERQERDRVTVVDWLVKPGDKVTKGMSLVTLDTKTGVRTLIAPADGVFVREVKHGRDLVALGDTVGYVEIDPVVWRAEYGK